MKIQPSREEFHRLAATHSVVPIWTEILGDLETPVAAFTAVIVAPGINAPLVSATVPLIELD